MRSPRNIIFLVVVWLGAGACAWESPIVDLSGECAEVYHGQVCSWTRTRGGKLLEIGATIPLASIEGAPDRNPNGMQWPPVAVASLSFPETARRTSGFTQLTMYWESGGHPPASYMTPHFDFHFNMIPASERMAISCTDLGKPAVLPPAYALPDIPLPPAMAKVMNVPVLVGLCIPQMGMHAMLRSEVDRKDMFHGSMVIGYYHKMPIFVEPMVTKAKLLERKSFTLPIPAIPGVGAHPTMFRADYDPTLNAYQFTFSGFAATE